MTRSSFAGRFWRTLYRLALQAYPASFRADFARDIEDTFVDRYRDARREGMLAVAALVAASLADAITHGLRERVHPHHFGYGMFHWMDVRYALRLLRRNPFFSALTILTLAGGLGVSIFTFSFLYTPILRPLPLPGGDRIVRIENDARNSAGAFDVAEFSAIRESITTLSTVGAFVGTDIVIGDERHRRVLGITASEPSLFELTGTRPILGRPFRAEDQQLGAETVIVLSHRSWERAFGADTAVVGTRVPLNAGFARIIGVMPEGYGFPVASDGWTPLSAAILAERTPGRQSVNLYARLRDGVSARAAESELDRLFDRARTALRTRADVRDPALVQVLTFPVAQIGDGAPWLLSALNLLASLILLLACINVTNLLLARANERARETAVRLALGASRGRLVMQSMWENVVICLSGGVVAIAIAGVGLSSINGWLHTNLADNLAFWWVWRLDRTAVLSACGFVTAAIVLLGCIVSARVMSTEFNAVLRDGSAGSGNRREGRIARILVVTQVTAVTVLMFFGVMSAVVAYRVAHVDVGYDTRRLLSATVDLPSDRYDSVETRRVFYRRLLDDVASKPAIEGALLRTTLASISDADGAFELGASRRAFDSQSPHAYVEASLGPLQTLGIGLRTGRMFETRDDERGTPVALVSRALADQYWPGRSPMGERVRLATDSGRYESRVIVGVVSDILMGAPFSRDRSAAAIYLPLAQTRVSQAALVFRHRGDVPASQAALYASLAAIDPRLAPPSVQTFEEILAKTALIATSVTKLFGVCFGFALLLAVSGMYGLMARSIGQRTREIGIRRALGATDGGVARLLVGQGGRQLGSGVLIALPVVAGIGFAFAANFPIGVATTVLSGVAVSATIVVVAMLATYVPARRALALSPRDALWRD